MPIINVSDYRKSFWMINEHWETIMPGILRKPKHLSYKRERITTSDGDFLDLDFMYREKNRIAILSHGLEGHADKYYMRGMAHQFIRNDWDTLSWNCRSCSQEINLKPQLYHHGATQDLDDVIQYVLEKGYEQVLLIGFSLGGSLVVKYLGESIRNPSNRIVGGIAFSIPCQLGSCAQQLSAPENSFYLNRFLQKLKNKITLKASQFPEIFNLEGLDSISSFYEFDSKYTAPLYGFENAEAFYTYASAGNYIHGIKIPVLLVNSLNDPMFPEDCYPYKAAKSHEYFFLETPKKGGHMGYWHIGEKVSWAEKRALHFVQHTIGLP